MPFAPVSGFILCWDEEERARKGWAAGPLDLGLRHPFQSLGADMGAQQQQDCEEPRISPSLFSSQQNEDILGLHSWFANSDERLFR